MMKLDRLYGWNMKANVDTAACGTACGSGDKPADDKPAEKPAACGTACGAGDKPEE